MTTLASSLYYYFAVVFLVTIRFLKYAIVSDYELKINIYENLLLIVFLQRHSVSKKNFLVAFLPFAGLNNSEGF